MLRLVLTAGAVAMVAASGASERVEVESHVDGHHAHMARIFRKGWRKHAHPSNKVMQKLDLVVAVKQGNTEKLTAELMAVSDPRSKRYGQHLSQAEVDALTAPTDEAVRAVTQWLESAGLSPEKVTTNGDFIHAHVTVAEAETLLNTTYTGYHHQDTETSVVRASAPYTLPADVAKHVDFVTPTTSFPPMHNKPKKSAPREDKFKVTPPFLRQLYKMTDADVGNGNKTNNSMAVASFIKQYYDPADLKLFWAKYAPPAPTEFTDVGAQSHAAEVEASIDSEYIAATGAGIDTQMWYTPGTQPGNVENEPFVAWLTNLAATANPPPVFSISYGDEESGVTQSYADRASVEFQKAGARGISLFAASGDSGAGCAAGAFVPTFPASSPYITGVGGLSPPGNTEQVAGTGETVAALSGGGFSNYFTRPSFQDDAVAAYLKQPGLPESKMYNAKGAGFPDISAQAIQYDTCSDAFFYPYDGTSCACPTVAGLFAMLNQVRAEAGKPALGYLNPWLYQNEGKGFNDITEGNNNYCDSPTAFPATHGWDSVSGWGSPDFSALKTIVNLM